MKKSFFNNLQHVLSFAHFVSFIYACNALSVVGVFAIAVSFIGTFAINAVLWDKAAL